MHNPWTDTDNGVLMAGGKVGGGLIRGEQRRGNRDI